MWDSVTTSTSLTAEDLQMAITRIEASDGFRPDMLLVPAQLLLIWLRYRVEEVERIVAKTRRQLAVKLSVSYYKRRRQRLTGVAQRQHEQRILARHALVGHLAELADVRAAYETESARYPKVIGCVT